MTVDRWNRIEKIFQSALELPSSQRRQYVEQACNGDDELRAEVNSLLANDSGGDTALRSMVEADILSLAYAECWPCDGKSLKRSKTEIES